MMSLSETLLLQGDRAKVHDFHHGLSSSLPSITANLVASQNKENQI